MDVALLRRENVTRTRCLQKSLDTFSPMGPWLVTRADGGRIPGDGRHDRLLDKAR